MKKIKNLKMMWKFSDETGNYEVSTVSYTHLDVYKRQERG